jgi:hypothetical protein
MVSRGKKPRGILLRRPLIRWFSGPRLVSPDGRSRRPVHWAGSLSMERRRPWT